MNEQQRRQLFLQEIGISTEWVRRTPVSTLLENETTTLSEQDFEIKNADNNSQSATLTVAPSLDDAAPIQERILPAQPVMRSPHTNEIAEMDWATLADTVSNCTRCGLCRTRTQTVFGVGNQSAEQLIVGEAPGEQEDKQGQPFVGQAGKLLDNMLHAVGLKRPENVYIANVLKCRPPGNRDPHPEEVMQCSPYLHRQIELLKPKRILVVGRFAAQTLLSTDTSIGKLRGRQHHYQGIPVVVTYHPAYLLRSPLEKAKAWADLCDFMQ